MSESKPADHPESGDARTEPQKSVSGKVADGAMEVGIVAELLDAGIPPNSRRQKLDSLGDRHSFSLWGFLKSVVGRDLTRVTMPIHFNEPLSFTQRIVEDLEYAYILNDAAECVDSLDCLARIAAFASSPYGSALDRHYKPFNPILGETYDAIRPEEGYCVVVEQVCHHPPITAVHCTGRKWELWQEYKLETRFRGNYIRVIPTGIVHLSMGKHRYSWNKPQTTIHNIMIGRLWLEHEGEVLVTNHTTGESALVLFQSYKSIGQKFKQLKGYVKDTAGMERIILQGNWQEGMTCHRVGLEDQAQTLWKSFPKPVNASRYGYTKLALQLNQYPPAIPDEQLCQTDSRLRPDERLYEQGRVDEAAREKSRLEDKQRSAKKQREQHGISWQPKWFHPQTDPDTNTISHVYKGGYWAAKKVKGFEDSADIF